MTLQQLGPADQMPAKRLTDWIRHTDEHAGHHLKLWRRAHDAVADAVAEAESPARLALSGEVQRWRYQLLNERATALAPDDHLLVDRLDQLARQLAGRMPMAPRAVRQAIEDESLETGAIATAVQALVERAPLETLVEQAQGLTRQNFGVSDSSSSQRRQRTRMRVYAPLYVSSECINSCTYCGFRYSEEIVRKHLTGEEFVQQMRILRRRGFQHLLLVAGDYPSLNKTGNLAELVRLSVAAGNRTAIEIAPQSTDSYGELVKAGVCSLTLYQETYDQQLYRQYHVRGPKTHYHWRLEGHDRAAEVGMQRLGLGILLGLADPRQDVRRLLRHGAYLSNRFPGRRLAFSLPRIHEAPAGFEVPFPVSDEQLIRLYCILRIAFPQAELVLSTRERVVLRNRLAKICITQMSAGSSTAPGGYQEDEPGTGEQFPVADDRTVTEVVQWLQANGFHVAWR